MVTVFGDVGHPALDCGTRVLVGDILTIHDYATRRALTQAGNHLSQLALSVAGDPRDADDLAGAHLDAEVAQRRDATIVLGANILHRKHHITGLDGVLLHREDHLAANHQGSELRLGDAHRAHRGRSHPAARARRSPDRRWRAPRAVCG